ncbi:helix-turn-helix domain-containing protein [Nonomuraea glycinis]|uniref:helix-turn-helix domain-containing protein n=1 Tax=Nonomuraea glycinis TaxID=2047744 RepID=UPI0033BD769B
MPVPAAELTIVGHYDQPSGYATRRASGAPSWLLMWTQAGAGHVEQSGVSFLAAPGDLVVLGSGAAHHYRVAPGAARWRFWWVHFQPRPSWPGWLAPHAAAPGCHRVAGVAPALHERIDHAFVRALRDARWLPPSALQNGRPGAAGHNPPSAREHGPPAVTGGPPVTAIAGSAAARELVLGAVEEVLVLVTASALRSEESGDARIRRALALIAAEPGAPHSVESLARAVALSPSRLAHLFTAETGRTPMRALREARMRHAATLLDATDLDIGQVAAASGFVSPFHFSRAFRRAYGLPPRDYRAR